MVQGLIGRSEDSVVRMLGTPQDASLMIGLNGVAVTTAWYGLLQVRFMNGILTSAEWSHRRWQD